MVKTFGKWHMFKNAIICCGNSEWRHRRWGSPFCRSKGPPFLRNDRPVAWPQAYHFARMVDLTVWRRRPTPIIKIKRFSQLSCPAGLHLFSNECSRVRIPLSEVVPRAIPQCTTRRWLSIPWCTTRRRLSSRWGDCAIIASSGVWPMKTLKHDHVISSGGIMLQPVFL